MKKRLCGDNGIETYPYGVFIAQIRPCNNGVIQVTLHGIYGAQNGTNTTLCIVCVALMIATEPCFETSSAYAACHPKKIIVHGCHDNLKPLSPTPFLSELVALLS
jgi:hypothetical protein